jgi:RNA recognition motif-containing protein
MAANLYVGNLTFTTDSNELERIFTPYGSVARANVITDRETGRSRGFGFVEMGNDDEAQRAIDALNGKEVNGRALTVNVARERSPR